MKTNLKDSLLNQANKKPHVPMQFQRNTLMREPNNWFFIIVCIVMSVIPFFVSGNSMLFMLTNIFILGVFAMSYDLLLGYTGIISFGHAMFFGIGAYSMALSLRFFDSAEAGVLVALAAAVILCFIVSLLVGLLSLRLKDTFYALITLAVATIFFITAEQWRSLTRGSDGFNFTAAIPNDLFGFINLMDRRVIYYIGLIFIITMFLLLRRFIYSPVGRTLQAIRENESRVASLGFNVLHYKLISTVVAGVVAGLAGIMYAFSIRFVNPDSVLGVELTIDVLLMTVIGGVGTLVGAIVGAGIIEFSSHWLMGLRDVHPIFERWVILFGIIFILIVIFFPAGIVGTIRQKWKSRRSSS